MLERAVRVLLVQFLDAAAQDAWTRLDKDKLTRILDERARKLGRLRDLLLKSTDLKPGKKDGLLKVLDKGTLGRACSDWWRCGLRIRVSSTSWLQPCESSPISFGDWTMPSRCETE